MSLIAIDFICGTCRLYTLTRWQVDEIVNLCCPLRSRYQQAPPTRKRCLKLSMTDGIQRVFGMEYRSINALEVCASSGLKVSSMTQVILFSFHSNAHIYMSMMVLFAILSEQGLT